MREVARALRELVPEARIGVAHGQMHERDLEKVMRDFVAQRDGVLFLGVNEGDLSDNTGSYDVAIEAEAGSSPR